MVLRFSNFRRQLWTVFSRVSYYGDVFLKILRTADFEKSGTKITRTDQENSKNFIKDGKND